MNIFKGTRLSRRVRTFFVAGFFLYSPFSAQADPLCKTYWGQNPTTKNIALYLAPPLSGANELQQTLKFRFEYQVRPTLGSSGEDEVSAIFAMNFRDGSPLNIKDRYGPIKKDQIMVMVQGYAYSYPELKLAAVAAAPTREPLTWPEYELTGNTMGTFKEITVDQQAGYVSESLEIFAEIAADRRISALLSCKRETAVPIPTCVLHEQNGRLSVETTFLRADLSSIDLVRHQTHNFTHCLVKD